MRIAPRKVQPRWSPVRVRPARSARVQVDRGGVRAAYASAGLGEEAADARVQLVEVEGQHRLGVTPGHGLDLGPGRVGGRVGGALRDLGEVDEHLVQLAHHRQDRGHLREVVLLAPRDPAVGHLGDLLAGAEALEDGAPGPAVRAQGGVDAAAVVVGEVEARGAARLVDAEARGRGEGEQDAAQPEALRAVRGEPG